MCQLWPRAVIGREVVGESHIFARKGGVCKGAPRVQPPGLGPVVRNFSIVTQLPRSLYSTWVM
jgi:hypothetical protein